MSADQTEAASPRRREKAKEKGDRPRSRELLSATAMLAGVCVLRMVAMDWPARWESVYEQCLRLGSVLPDAGAWTVSRSPLRGAGMVDAPAVFAGLLRSISMQLIAPFGLLFASVLAATALAGVAQGGGFEFHAEALAPKIDRLNPATNLKNLFSLKSLLRLAKSLLPVGVLAVLLLNKITFQASLPVMSVARLPRIFADSYDLLLGTAMVTFAWSALDYLAERRSWEQRLRMSKQEQREEFKEQEGSPQVRQRIRSIQRQTRRRKLRADVSRATVVVTNPTHYAVALDFNFETMEPPKVLAKGRDLLAEQIKHEARWAGVPVVENPPLARSLYRAVEAGESIPLELYAAVAGILAYLYRKEVEERARRAAAEQQRAVAVQAKVKNTAPKRRPIEPEGTVVPGADGRPGSAAASSAQADPHSSEQAPAPGATRAPGAKP